MGIVYWIDPKNGIFFERWVDDITAYDVEEYWSIKLPLLKSENLLISYCDIRESRFVFSGEILRKLVYAKLSPELRGLGASAIILTNTGLQYGVARQFLVFSENVIYTEILSDERASQALLWSWVRGKNRHN